MKEGVRGGAWSRVAREIQAVISRYALDKSRARDQRALTPGVFPRPRVAGVPGPCDTLRVAARITLAGDLNGEYVVDEVLDDGRLVIRPDTTAEAIHRRLGLQPVSAEEFEQHFGDLPTDHEG